MNYTYNLQAINPNNPQIDQLDLLKKKLLFCSKKSSNYFSRIMRKSFFVTVSDGKGNKKPILPKILKCNIVEKVKPAKNSGLLKNTLMLGGGQCICNLRYSLQVYFCQGISSYKERVIMSFANLPHLSGVRCLLNKFIALSKASYLNPKKGYQYELKIPQNELWPLITKEPQNNFFLHRKQRKEKIYTKTSQFFCRSIFLSMQDLMSLLKEIIMKSINLSNFTNMFFATPFCMKGGNEINNINMLSEILNCSSFKKEKPVIANGPQNTLVLLGRSVFSNLSYSLQIHLPQGISSYNGRDMMNYIYNKNQNIPSNTPINLLHLLKKYLISYSKSIVVNLSHLKEFVNNCLFNKIIALSKASYLNPKKGYQYELKIPQNELWPLITKEPQNNFFLHRKERKEKIYIKTSQFFCRSIFLSMQDLMSLLKEIIMKSINLSNFTNMFFATPSFGKEGK